MQITPIRRITQKVLMLNVLVCRDAKFCVSTGRRWLKKNREIRISPAGFCRPEYRLALQGGYCCVMYHFFVADVVFFEQKIAIL